MKSPETESVNQRLLNLIPQCSLHHGLTFLYFHVLEVALMPTKSLSGAAGITDEVRLGKEQCLGFLENSLQVQEKVFSLSRVLCFFLRHFFFCSFKYILLAGRIVQCK